MVLHVRGCFGMSGHSYKPHKRTVYAVCQSVRLEFSGGRGGDTFKPPPPPFEQLLPLPTVASCFKMFLKRSLNDPSPPNFKHPSLLPPPHPPPLPPNKDFDHTQRLLVTPAPTLNRIFFNNFSSQPQFI